MAGTKTATTEARSPEGPQGSFVEVLAAFTKLGLTSFGGPIAHLGYFRDELVVRRGWTDEGSYADLVALCQFLPGPASSQVGIGMGMARAGVWGGFAAWLGFTLPSALALIAFAFGVSAIGDISEAGWLQGLKIVAVAVVAHAVWGMATNLTPDRPRITVAVLAAIAALAWPTSLGQVLIILAGGFIGWRLLPGEPLIPQKHGHYRIKRRVGALLLTLFFGLLLVLPVLREASASFPLAVFDSFYRAGSLVFGGGHVVLPLLQTEVVPPGWVDNETFVAGYGAAQAVPGPLFTFAAYLGAVMQPGFAGLWTATVALVAVFVPSFLLLIGVLPFWDGLRALSPVQAALRGVNAAVVGILLAALYSPVWTSAIFRPVDFALALGAFLVLSFWKWPPWLVVVLTAAAAAIIARVL
ncbi:MAG: chromate efflux transporter [Deinococcota bacterium]|jgi:chromate transporter|nr:chromate efflux transporter [Deinococcota bacterium]